MGGISVGIEDLEVDLGPVVESIGGMPLVDLPNLEHAGSIGTATPGCRGGADWVPPRVDQVSFPRLSSVDWFSLAFADRVDLPALVYLAGGLALCVAANALAVARVRD